MESLILVDGVYVTATGRRASPAEIAAQAPAEPDVGQ